MGQGLKRMKDRQNKKKSKPVLNRKYDFLRVFEIKIDKTVTQ